MKNSGFTLVELIAVIIILGILAAVGIPQYRRVMERARGGEASAGLANIQEAEKIYYVINQVYMSTTEPKMTPTEQKTLDINLPQSGWNFVVTTPALQKFTGTATRLLGPCSTGPNNTVTIDEVGTLIDLWKLCVDAL